jgi:hypothetical protein
MRSRSGTSPWLNLTLVIVSTMLTAASNEPTRVGPGRLADEEPPEPAFLCDLMVGTARHPLDDGGVGAGVGEEVHLVGIDFPPTVDLIFNHPPGGPVNLSRTVTASGGSFAFTAYFSPGFEGGWEVLAVQFGYGNLTCIDEVNVSVVTGHPFLDIGSHPFESEIAWLYQRRTTTGCSTDAFCADASVTREQMASFLARALNLPATATDFFGDDAGSVHEADINRLAAAGIASGCGSDRFCPTKPVAREQMASFLARALNLPATATDFFGDDTGSVHEADINRLAAAGIASGCGTDRFCPSGIVSRGQTAAFLERGLSDATVIPDDLDG